MAATVVAVVVLLFASVGALLLYGAYMFRRHGPESRVESGVNMLRDVLWTAVAAGLLLGIFVWIR